jgi:hypothetical protein
LQKVPVSKQEWRNCAEKLAGLRFVEEGFPESIETYSEQYQDWIPVFWISDDGSGFMRASGFFQSDVSYERAIEMATFLKAYIYGDDGEVYFLPGYGTVIDDAERETPDLYFEDVRRYRNAFGNDYERIVAAAKQEKANRKKQAATSGVATPIRASKPKHRSKAWMLLVALLAALAIIYLIYW